MRRSAQAKFVNLKRPVLCSESPIIYFAVLSVYSVVLRSFDDFGLSAGLH